MDTSAEERVLPVLSRCADPLNLPRGIVICAVIDNAEIRNTRRFAIATAQALFARAGVSRFLRTHSAAHTGGGPPETSADTSNYYACAMRRAMDLVYSGGRNPIVPEDHSLWSGESWVSPYPEFAKTLPDTFPAEMQHAAWEYLEYVSGLLSRAEATAPTGECPRDFGDCIGCGAKPAPRSFPLYYAATPRPPGSCEEVAPSDLLAGTETSAPFLLKTQDPGRCLAMVGGGYYLHPTAFWWARGR